MLRERAPRKGLAIKLRCLRAVRLQGPRHRAGLPVVEMATAAKQ